MLFYWNVWSYYSFIYISCWNTSLFFKLFLSFFFILFLYLHPPPLFRLVCSCSLIRSFLTCHSFISLSFNHSFSILNCHSVRVAMWYRALFKRACGHPGDFHSSVNSPFRTHSSSLTQWDVISTTLLTFIQKKICTILRLIQVDSGFFYNDCHRWSVNYLHMCVGMCMNWEMSQLCVCGSLLSISQVISHPAVCK